MAGVEMVQGKENATGLVAGQDTVISSLDQRRLENRGVAARVVALKTALGLRWVLRLPLHQAMIRSQPAKTSI